jgi:pimeloyl-ACP methyl ester carboxylesterase
MEWIIGLLAVAGMAAGVAWYTAGSGERPLTAAERERLAPGSAIRLSDGDIHYTLRGPADGRVIVMVHGFGVPQFVFEQNAAGLAQAGYRVVLFDHFGRGWSDRPRAAYDVEFYDRELAELISDLRLHEPVGLVGYSMGGVIAAEFAARHSGRVAALVLLSPAGLSIYPFLGKVFGRMLHVPLIGDWLWGMRARPLLLGDPQFQAPLPDPDRQMQGDDTVQMKYRGYFNALLQSWRHLPMKNRDAAFAAAARKVPVLALFGGRDRTIPPDCADRLRHAAPDAEVETIAEGTHGMLYEMHDTITPRIIRFLDAHLH